MKPWWLVMGAAILAAGCGQQASESTPSGAASPRPSPTATPIVVGIVSPAKTSTFHVTLTDGFKEQCAQYGWQVRDLAPDVESNFAEQVNQVEALIQNRVAAISICAINPSAIVAAVHKAKVAGIPIFVHNSLTELPENAEVQAYIGYDQRAAGRLCGEYTVKYLTQKYGEPRGKVYILLGLPGFHTEERSGGFREALKDYPNIQIVGEASAEWDRLKGMNVAAAALQATPDIDVFFGCSDAMDQGAARAAIEAGKQVMTIGIDGNPDTLKEIKEGVVTATCAVFPRDMGKIAAQTIKDHLDGKPVPKFVQTKLEIIDRSNVDQYLQ